RHLIVRTTYTAALDFDQRLHVVDRSVEHLDRLFASFSLNLVQGAVHDALCNGLLARQHNNVHEFGELNTAEFRIRENLTLGNFATTRHFLLPCDCSVGPLFTATAPHQGVPLTCAGPDPTLHCMTFTVG